MKSVRRSTRLTGTPKPVTTYTPPAGYESGLTKNQILSELSRSPHGNLKEYVPVGQVATKQEAEFMAHLIAWNHQKGAIRDSKTALPIVSLSVPGFHSELAENSLAHFGLLGPREMEKAFRFAIELKVPSKTRKKVADVITQYLRKCESSDSKWDRVAVQHRDTLKSLYCLTYTKPSERAQIVLFGCMPDKVDGKRVKVPYPPGSVFADIQRLKDMSPSEAAGVIVSRKIPFLIAMGALGKKAQEVDLVLALIERMSPTELVTNTKMLEKLGVKTNPALRGAFEKALEKASKSKKNVLKTTRAAEAIEDEDLKVKLQGMQERQLNNMAGPSGSWLVLADKSGSMHSAIEVARLVSATLARMCKGKVLLVFFDSVPRAVDVTGKTYEDIISLTKHVTAGGSTSVGCGLKYALDAKMDFDGIAVISDGGENCVPYFHQAYPLYAEFVGKQPPVYLYRTNGERNVFTGLLASAGIDSQIFDIADNIDFYSVNNLVLTMREQRFGVLQEIMDTPLLTLADVFKEETVSV